MRAGILFCVLLLSGVTDLFAQADPSQPFIKKKIEQIQRDGQLQIEGDHISAILVIPAFYEQREFRRAWTNPYNVRGLVRAIQDVQNDGLTPKDYHYNALVRLRNRIEASSVPDPEALAEVDLLLSDALLRLGYHILFGKVDPERLDPNWNLAREINDMRPETALQDVLSSGDVYEFIEHAKPKKDYYVRLKKALAEYREIQKAGGWPTVAEGATLKLGMTSDRMPKLRERLAVTGDLPDNASRESQLFDDELEEAVERFQRRHNLSDDGVVGKGTLAELNVPVESRIDQIRVNLERGRWILHDIADEFVLVNIAGFKVAHLERNSVSWLSRVQVGKPYRKTPVFKAEMKYIVFNPTWTVPPTILAKDVLPAIKRDPSYLKRKNMSVLDHSGKVIDQTTIDWSKYPGSNFPYIIRQGPGPTNALGLVKFIFPNKHFVFLHDTPSKSLFDRETRTFSSGCIRVENPFELAEQLLDDPEKWNQQTIARVIKEEKTRTVYLDSPVPVLILYWTAIVEDDGRVSFIRDVYERDQTILDDLNAGFRLRTRDLRERSKR
jgi:murein L,D-transpeptidase YcbB/YkuD